MQADGRLTLVVLYEKHKSHEERVESVSEEEIWIDWSSLESGGRSGREEGGEGGEKRKEGGGERKEGGGEREKRKEGGGEREEGGWEGK